MSRRSAAEPRRRVSAALAPPAQGGRAAHRRVSERSGSSPEPHTPFLAYPRRRKRY